jgi:hypothetical protein
VRRREFRLVASGGFGGLSAGAFVPFYSIEIGCVLLLAALVTLLWRW